jgi:N-acetylneuraminic acid mutarotase
MKFLAVLILATLSVNSFAEMVFMREFAEEKHIMLQDKTGAVKAITTGPLMHLYPDISSDGKSIVYVEGRILETGTQDLEIMIKNLETNQLEKWQSDLKGLVLHPKFTRNGQYVFFSAPGPKNTIFFFEPQKFRAAKKNKSDVGILKFTPTALDSSEESYFPRPSSDGAFVVYQRNTKGLKEVVLFDRLENTKTVLDTGMSPSLSFDERYISYTSKKAGSWDVYQYDRILKSTTRLTLDDSSDEMAPTYRPNNELVFASNKTGRFQLYQLNNTEWIRLTEIENTDDYAPQYSGETGFTQGMKAPFMAPIRSSFGTIFHNGLLYMCGGHEGPEHTYPEESFKDHLNVYNPATNAWKVLAPRLHKAHGFQLAAHGNYIYAFGGFAFSANHKPGWKSLDVIERYDIRTNEWKIIGKLPRNRSSNVSAVIDDKVYLIGGWDSTPKHANDYNGTFHSKIDVFDMKTETVSIASFEMPKPLRRAFTGLNYNGKILLVGGLGVGASHFELISRITLLDPTTGDVTELPELPFATFAPAAEIINDQLFVFGGMFKTGEMNYEYVSHIYGFNFTKNKWRHTGRYLTETKGFSQVFKLDENTVGILGGHRYNMNEDKPVNTFETFFAK